MTHRRCPSRAAMLLLCCALPAAAPGAARALPPDNKPAVRTVPLPHVLRDETGAALTVNADGSVNDGQGDLFDAGAQLFVGNNFQYAPEIAHATYDPRHNELRFPPMPANGLNVSRRVSVDARSGWWRFVETLENPGPAPVRAQVRVRFDLSGAIQAVEHVVDERRGSSTAGVAVFDG